MNIKSLENAKYDGTSKTYNIQNPSFINNITVELFEYTVQLGETMRPDLIMKSIYKNSINYQDLDVILHINGIDNPLNIKEGMKILYPNLAELGKFRYSLKGNELNNDKESLSEEISKVDKSTRKDKNREEYVKSDYKLPPVVNNAPKPAVRVQNGNIRIGGI